MAADDQWASWAQSVQDLKSPACLDWTAIEMPDVLLPPWSPAGNPASSRVPALRAALKDWFDRPGCRDPNALNFNASALQDDGSCSYPDCIANKTCRVTIEGWTSSTQLQCPQEGTPPCKWDGYAGACGGGKGSHSCGVHSHGYEWLTIGDVREEGIDIYQCHKCPCDRNSQSTVKHTLPFGCTSYKSCSTVSGCGFETFNVSVANVPHARQSLAVV